MRARITALGALQEERLAPFRTDPRFENVRSLGTVAALDVKVSDPGYMAGAALQLSAHFLSRNILLRPLGNTIYVLPPYCINAAELDMIYAAIAECV